MDLLRIVICHRYIKENLSGEQDSSFILMGQIALLFAFKHRLKEDVKIGKTGQMIERNG